MSYNHGEKNGMVPVIPWVSVNFFPELNESINSFFFGFKQREIMCAG